MKTLKQLIDAVKADNETLLFFDYIKEHAENRIVTYSHTSSNNKELSVNGNNLLDKFKKDTTLNKEQKLNAALLFVANLFAQGLKNNEQYPGYTTIGVKALMNLIDPSIAVPTTTDWRWDSCNIPNHLQLTAVYGQSNSYTYHCEQFAKLDKEDLNLFTNYVKTRYRKVINEKAREANTLNPDLNEFAYTLLSHKLEENSITGEDACKYVEKVHTEFNKIRKTSDRLEKENTIGIYCNYLELFFNASKTKSKKLIKQIADALSYNVYWHANGLTEEHTIPLITGRLIQTGSSKYHETTGNMENKTGIFYREETQVDGKVEIKEHYIKAKVKRVHVTPTLLNSLARCLNIQLSTTTISMSDSHVTDIVTDVPFNMPESPTHKLFIIDAIRVFNTAAQHPNFQDSLKPVFHKTAQFLLNNVANDEKALKLFEEAAAIQRIDPMKGLTYESI